MTAYLESPTVQPYNEAGDKNSHTSLGTASHPHEVYATVSSGSQSNGYTSRNGEHL